MNQHFIIMRTLLFIAICFISACAFAQSSPEVNDELVIAEPSSYTFSHLDFPKANLLIKRAVVPNYAALAGVNVVVSEVDLEAGKVVLRRADGKNFFRYYPQITANFSAALEAGELRRL